jgi:hypothetical protein
VPWENEADAQRDGRRDVSHGTSPATMPENGYDAHWHATGFVKQELTRVLSVYGEAALLATSSGLSKSTGSRRRRRAFADHERACTLDYETAARAYNSRTSDWTHVLRVNWGW